jgi:hypothetical protein
LMCILITKVNESWGKCGHKLHLVKFSTTRDLKVVPFILAYLVKFTRSEWPRGKTLPVRAFAPHGGRGPVFEWSQFVVPAKDVETPVRVLPRTSPERQAVPLALRS